MYWKSIGPQRFKLNRVGYFGGDCIYKAESESQQYNIICVKYMGRLTRNVWIVSSLALISHVIIVVGPVYAYFYQNIRVTPLATNLPFFEKDSDLEFTVNMILQSIMAFYAMAGCIAIEMGICLINNAISATPDVIRFNLVEFEREFNTNGISLEATARLRNVFIQIQDFIR